ncbi:MAG: helix-turn-helix domain-containing protein [Chloroflexota bacterium]|nr:helix-turn-helix domain-containing protein [Chloroflexota bacterium]
MGSNRRTLALTGQTREDRHTPRALHPATIGDLLLCYRIAAGLTQEELAERATLSVRAIGDIERGVKQRPHRETIRLLADALALSDEERDCFLATARQQRTLPPTLAPVLSSPSNLPAQVTPLVGRAEAVREASTMLRREAVRLLTITGTGGVGKTRLAIAVADDICAEMPDGVVFVPLAAVRDPALVPYVVAQALDVRERVGESPDAAIVGAIGQKRLLLVLDNFEHLPTAAAFVGVVLAACPRLAALVTSRAPLHLYGEHEFPLEPLAIPPARQSADLAALARVPAVTLFIQRAGDSPRLPAHTGQCGRRRGHLPPPRRPAPRPRTGSGAYPPARPCRTTRTPRSPVAPAHNRSCGSPPTPANDAGRDRLESRSARCGRTAIVPAVGDL